MTLYAMSYGAQRKEVEHYCFDMCGKVLVGGEIDLSGGMFATCREENCPYVIDTADLGDNELEGPHGNKRVEHLIVRKLKGV